MSSVCFIIIGISFLLIHSEAEQKKKIPGYLLSIIPIMIGTLRLLDFSWGSHLGIDGVLFPNELQSELPGVLSNRMSPNTAFNFQALGLANILASLTNRLFRRIANYISVLSLLVSIFSIISYFYGVKEFFGFLTYIPMSLHSAIVFMVVGMAVLFMNNEFGFMSVITSSYSGGTISRLLIPTAVLAPFLVGYVRLVSERKSPIPVELGIAFLITFIVVLLFSMILMVSFIINRKDIERKIAEDKLALVNSELEKKVEERSREIYSNEKRYRSLIENSAEGITLLNDKLMPIYQSPAVTLITGYDLEERKINNGLELIHENDQSAAKNLFTSLLTNPNRSFPFLYRIKHKKGHFTWIEGVVINLLSDPDINSIVTNYRDVTERKEYEIKIAASEQGLRAILESSADAYIITKKDLSVTYQSLSAERITGISVEYRLTHPEIRFTHPDDVPIVEALVKEILRNPVIPLPFQVRFLHANGHYIWIEGMMSNLLHDPNVNGLTFHYRDVTDRKNYEQQKDASEQRFRALIENISDAIVLNGRDSSILYQSPSATRILGYEPEERKGKFGIDYVHPDYRETFTELYKKLELIPGKPFSFQYRFLHKNGKYIWLEGFVTNLLHDPNVMAYVENYRDISDRKDSEEKIVSLNTELEERVDLRTKQLQAANKEMEAFTYSVSHDLRAPLRIINGFAQILIEDYSDKIDEAGQKIMGRIMGNARRMGRLIDDLLDFSRLGRAEIKLSQINMNAAVTEVMEELVNSGISLPNELLIENLSTAIGDFNLIKQVWSNLISNAIKYSGKKEFPRIEIGMIRDTSKSIYFIKDNGDGFDMQYYSKLFGVFQRLHKESEFTGTGVGLALVQRIILRHGGRVWAESKPGEGAVFYFSIPM